MSKMRSFASLALAGAALAMGSISASAATCGGSPSLPGIGNDTNGPALCIDITPSGTSIVNGPGNSQGPYDGNEDTYIGVFNDGTTPLSSITVSSSTLQIFGFDGDGIGSSSFGAGTNAKDTSDGNYGGPNAFFTNIAANRMSGTVNFVTSIPVGGQDIFSLEEPLSTSSIGVGNTPVPAALPLFATGLGALGLLGLRRKRKAQAVA